MINNPKKIKICEMRVRTSPIPNIEDATQDPRKKKV